MHLNLFFDLLQSICFEPILLLKGSNLFRIVLDIFELLLHASHLLMQSLVDFLVALALKINFIEFVLKTIDSFD